MWWLLVVMGQFTGGAQAKASTSSPKGGGGTLGPEGRVPAWTAQPFSATASVNTSMAYNLPVANNSGSVKVYNAMLATDVYTHAPMLSYNDGYFLATWKNGVLSEDQPGGRVLWSYATADEPLVYGTPQILFPNMSNGGICLPNRPTPYPKNPHYLTPECAHLFAEPTVEINGHVYVAASLRQFCLWPLDALNAGGKYLLLRRVDLSSAPKLGPIFWAHDPGELWRETNVRLDIRTLEQMDADTRGDIAELLAGSRPCRQNATKCEFCPGGCQDLRGAAAADAPCKLADIGGPWIERTHWHVPNTTGDVLVYRAEGKTLCYSHRSNVGENWTEPRRSKLGDIHSNTNAGTLPDGRVYLLHNPIFGIVERDPLVLSLSSDGFNFDQAFVAFSCRLPPLSSKNSVCPNASSMSLCPHLGCKRRNPGGGSQGPQYPQGLVHDGDLYIIMSMNKEDIWVVRIPIKSL
eukprot:SAG31_NODE_3761_length_3906_cov_4.295246_2_plen_463_part_00